MVKFMKKLLALFLLVSTSVQAQVIGGPVVGGGGGGGGGVTSFSAGTTGFTPSTTSTGAVTLGGVLSVANGGTGNGAFTQGSIIFDGAGNVLSQNNANFFWDNANLRMGIRTATPAAILDINPGTSSTAAFWGLNGIGVNARAGSFNDSSSSGTQAGAAAVYSIQSPTITATSPTTYSNIFSTLYIGAPIAGANATLSNSYAINTQGSVNVGALFSSGLVRGTYLQVTGPTLSPNGVSLPSANTLQLSTNSTAALTVTATQTIGIGTTTPRNSSTLDVNGITAVAQLVGNSGAPTVAVGAGAGSGATASIAGTNLAGVVTVSTGTSTTGSSVLATITFNGTLGTAPQGCTLFPRNANAVGQVAMVYTTAPSTTIWTISVGGSAIPASTTSFIWSYACI